MRKILIKIWWWTCRQPLTCSVPSRCTDIYENQTLSPHAVVTNDGDIDDSIYLSLWRQTQLMKSLEEVILHWIERVAARRTDVQQQDCAPYHTSRRTQCWMSEIFCDYITPNIWSSNSSDFTCFDYYVPGTVKWETHKLCASPKWNWRQR